MISSESDKKMLRRLPECGMIKKYLRSVGKSDGI